ncbi:radical SAM protein [uncultured Draconibacterium sp.]|uniref:radical SAM protein n=1 Tax=uncultured Draconibacterium sp. TaxID=1573823 RepID=UPI0025E4A715|nr:radical SAM protein [uncultured Draconibacterium sp.]
MKFTGPIYRPPYEANTPLLQVTVGCAHNKCTFCTMYRDVRFSMEKLEQVEKDLQEARQLYKNVKRIFLVNGDAFVLSAGRLKPIAELIIRYFPEIETISMYASINNIKGKTDDELAELKRLKISDLWVGVETGHAQTLQFMKKGFSQEEAYAQLQRLNKAGISYMFGFMYGAAGSGKGIENAIETAKIINATKPKGVVPTTLGAFGESELANEVVNGNFTPATEQEVLEEQKKLIELIDIETDYMGIHALNTVAFDAKFPRDKQAAVARIEHAMEHLSENYLSSIPKRNSV